MTRCPECREWLIPRYDASSRRVKRTTLAQHLTHCSRLAELNQAIARLPLKPKKGRAK